MSVLRVIKGGLLWGCIVAIMAGVLYVLNSAVIIDIKGYITAMNPNVEGSKSSVLKADKAVEARVLFLSDTESDLELLDRLKTQLDMNSFDAIIVTGDITHLGTQDELTAYRDALDNTGIKYYVIPGDRDLWKGGIDLYQTVFGLSYYSVDVKGSNLLFIDNSDEYKGISEEQFNFIEEKINKVDFIVLHNPIYFEGSILSQLLHKGMGQYSTEVEQQRVKLLDLVKSSDSVKAIFAGDQHIFTKSKLEEKELYFYNLGSFNSERSIGNPTYAILTLNDDDTYEVENISLPLD